MQTKTPNTDQENPKAIMRGLIARSHHLPGMRRQDKFQSGLQTRTEKMQFDLTTSWIWWVLLIVRRRRRMIMCMSRM